MSEKPAMERLGVLCEGNGWWMELTVAADMSKTRRGDPYREMEALRTRSRVSRKILATRPVRSGNLEAAARGLAA